MRTQEQIKAHWESVWADREKTEREYEAIKKQRALEEWEVEYLNTLRERINHFTSYMTGLEFAMSNE